MTWFKENILNKKLNKKSVEELKKLSDPKGNLLLGENVRLSLSSLNKKNVLVLGPSGAGKTQFYTKKNISAEEDNNIIVFDAYEDIYDSTHEEAERKGYEVLRFSTQKSDNGAQSLKFNPLEYCTDDESIHELVKNIMYHTKGSESWGDPFWYDSCRMFLIVIVYYLFAKKPGAGMDEILKCIKEFSEEGSRKRYELFYEECKAEDKYKSYVSAYDTINMISKKSFSACLADLYVRLTFMNLKEFKDLVSEDEIKLNERFNKKTILYIGYNVIDKTMELLPMILLDRCVRMIMDRGKDQKRHTRIILDSYLDFGIFPDFKRYLCETSFYYPISFELTADSIDRMNISVYGKDKCDAEFIYNCIGAMVVMGVLTEKTAWFVRDKWNKANAKRSIEDTDICDMNYEHEIIFLDCGLNTKSVVDVKCGLKERK